MTAKLHGAGGAHALTARTGGVLRGTVQVPGDKSLSHRALMFGALAVGESTSYSCSIAGLTADLEAAIRSPALEGYEHILLLGYSLGGHIALRYACSRPNERVRAVAAICSPLDLDRGARHLDERHMRHGPWK